MLALAASAAAAVAATCHGVPAMLDSLLKLFPIAIWIVVAPVSLGFPFYIVPSAIGIA